MAWLILLLSAAAAGLLVASLGLLLPSRERTLHARILELQGGRTTREAELVRRRQERAARIRSLMQRLGAPATPKRRDGRPGTALLLRQAGFRDPGTPAVFLGTRVAGALLLWGAAFGAGSLIPTGEGTRSLLLVSGLLTGWMGPWVVVSRIRRNRIRALQRGLPDALDLLVVSVEAGMGLNQALVRVAEEIDRVHPELSDELTFATLEMRAGKAREEALRGIADRSGVDDVRAWVSTLVQTERFGSSIANALRIHADGMRTQRRQRAEEAAAKLTVKLLVPLLLFVFPATFVVVLGPAFLVIAEVFS